MFLLLSLSSARSIKVATEPTYEAASNANEKFDLSNIEEFTINVVKPNTIVTIPMKQLFEAKAFDSEGKEIKSQAEKFYRFNFGEKTGKITVKKLSRQPMFYFKVSIIGKERKIEGLLDKEVKVNESSGAVAGIACAFIFGGFIIIGFFFFCCCKPVCCGPTPTRTRRFSSSSDQGTQHRTIIIQNTTPQQPVQQQVMAQPQYVPQQPMMQPQQQYVAPQPQYVAPAPMQYQYPQQPQFQQTSLMQPQQMVDSKNPYDGVY